MSSHYDYQFKVFVQYNSYSESYVPYSNTIYANHDEAQLICDLLEQDPDVFGAMVFYRKFTDWEPT